MKRLQSERAKSSTNAKTGTIKKSASSSSCGNGSIVEMFQRQKEKWNALCESFVKSESTPCSSSPSLSGTSQRGDDFNKEIFRNSNTDQHGCRINSADISEGCGDMFKSSLVKNCEAVTHSLPSDVVLAQEDVVGNRSIVSSCDRSVGRLSLKRKRTPSVSNAFETAVNTVEICDRLPLSSCLSSCEILNEEPNDLLKSFSDEVACLSGAGNSTADELSVSKNSELGDSKDDSDLAVNETEASTNHSDYYVDNFSLVLKVVMEDEYHFDLFNESDTEVVNIFQNHLSEAARRLYVRLFLRKHRWLRREKITYPLIAADLKETLDELTAIGFLSDESCMNDFREVIMCLPAPELRTLAKSLRINLSSKLSLAESVVKHVMRCDTNNFFAQNKGLTEKVTMKRAKSMLGSCYKLVGEKRDVFIRALMLFGLHNTLGDDESYGQQLIFQMLMTQIGRLRYPEYKVLRKTRIFANREAVIRYAEALQMESELCQCLEKKDYNQCYVLYIRIKEIAGGYLANEDMVDLDSVLPAHLRLFTSGAIYVRLLTHGVEILQFLKKYEDAVTQLHQLLDQEVYHQNYRGRWYDRLALNLDYHLKKPLESLEVIKSSLNDSFVRTGHRYNLLQRAKKICASNAVKKSRPLLWTEFQDDPMNSVIEAPSVTITGQQLYRDIPGCNTVWVSSTSNHDDDADAKVMTRVEEVALRHYADNDYPEGIHGEGATFRCLFSLFMWDILFMENIEDVFYNEYQTHPLDITSDSFYSSRESAIIDRLEMIRKSTNEVLSKILSEAWTLHQDTTCFGVNWELFRGLDHALGLVKCFGGSVLAGIFDRMARLMRSVTGGVPDLVVWNPETQKFKIVEVKGPGDRLSTKQILWLDYLVQLGVDAEVCHVRAVGAKALTGVK